MTTQSITMDTDVKDTLVKRCCECQGYKTNNMVGKFGPHYCLLCEE